MAIEKGRFGTEKGEAPNVQTSTRKGKLKKMYEEMVEQYQMMEAVGKSPADYMFTWMRDENIPIDIRARSAFKLEETKLKMIANEGIGAAEEQVRDLRTIDRMLEEKMKSLGLFEAEPEEDTEAEEE